MNGVGFLFRTVPDKLQIRYAARGDQISLSSWEIGDDTNELWAMAVRFDWEVNKGDVYEFMAAAHSHAVSARTVRDNAAIAEFFSPETRSKYDVLTFNHFRTARSFGDEWETILDGAMRYLDERGRLPSCDWLIAHYRGVAQAPQVADIDEYTQELDEAKYVIDRDYMDIPQHAVVDVDDMTLGELSYKQHAIMQGMVRSMKFLHWSLERIPDLGVLSFELADAIEKLESVVARILQELTKEEKGV